MGPCYETQRGRGEWDAQKSREYVQDLRQKIGSPQSPEREGEREEMFGWVLTGVAQWTECQPVNQRVTGSIPSHGTRLGCMPGP